MTIEERDDIKNEINKKIKEQEIRIEEMEIATKPISPDSALGRITRTDGMYTQAIGGAGLVRAKEELQGLVRQLTIIDTPEFGMCRMCKGYIGIERLKALPYTTKCIACAEKFS